MANPLHFVPKVDPKLELQRQLDAAPLENAEALLVAYDILKTAHANGTLDLVNGQPLAAGLADKRHHLIELFFSLEKGLFLCRDHHRPP